MLDREVGVLGRAEGLRGVCEPVGETSAPANDGCHGAFAAWGMHTPLRPSALSVMLETVTLMRPLVAVIEGHDKDLARQIRRAANSVALNLAEAAGSDRGNRRARLHTALGSARETRTGFQGADLILSKM